MNYNNKKFRAVTNTDNGDTSSQTVFHYQQEDNLVFAKYHGGLIKRGHLIGIVDINGNIEMRYHHIDIHGRIKTGKCNSKPEILDDGRIRLHETWQWTCDDQSSGNSIIEEIRD